MFAIHCQSRPLMSWVFLVFIIVLASNMRSSLADGVVARNLGWRSGPCCGPNCLYVLLFLCGKRPDYQSLVAKSGLTEQGASVAALARVAKEYGVSLTPLRAQASGLEILPLPAIAHCRNAREDRGHYLLILAVNTDGTLTVLEATSGDIYQMPKGDFLAKWSGVLLVTQAHSAIKLVDRMLVASSGLLLGVAVTVSLRMWRWQRG